VMGAPPSVPDFTVAIVNHAVCCSTSMRKRKVRPPRAMVPASGLHSSVAAVHPAILIEVITGVASPPTVPD
jgi:hypothetical protein